MKTEKEKMLAGEVYDCADNELLTRWHKAKQLQGGIMSGLVLLSLWTMVRIFISGRM